MTRRTQRTDRASREPKFLAVGKVFRPHGVRGELLLEVHTGSPARLTEMDTIYLGDEHTPQQLLSSRLHRGNLLIKIEGCNGREYADTLRGVLISIAIQDAVPLKPGEYYHHQIVGLSVVSDEGEPLGTVTEILETGANDVYVVNGLERELLLPAIKSVILKIEPPQMTVHLVEGLR